MHLFLKGDGAGVETYEFLERSSQSSGRLVNEYLRRLGNACARRADLNRFSGDSDFDQPVNGAGYFPRLGRAEGSLTLSGPHWPEPRRSVWVDPAVCRYH